MSDEVLTLTGKIAILLFWVRVLVVIAVVAIATDVVALCMFITFRRTAIVRLSQQRDTLRELGELFEVVKQHTMLACEQKDQTKTALESIKIETAKTVNAATTVAEKAEKVVAVAMTAAGVEKVAEAVNTVADRIGAATDAAIESYRHPA